ncbi:MAG: glycosyl transferase family protein [Kiritimatiellae bacterium]|nr:glycosyl transferase family protein [Kiritimatiellia bacterium]
MGDGFFYVWLTFRYLFIVLVFAFLLNGLDDLFIDIVFYLRRMYRAIFVRKLIRPVTAEQLAAVPEKLAAVMIPAWDESNVIRRMLLNTVGTFDYRNYRVFVGAYPNDDATKMEVERVREIYPNVELVVTPNPGPTNKADCLNWVYQGIMVFEQEHDCRFEFFVMHDAEDVVHAQSLKYFNYLIPRMDFIQIPVFPMPTTWYNFVTGTYMDEFAESHTKDLRVREIVAKGIPSAGVGTALSRAAMEYLARQRNNQIFDTGSVTEDYLMAVRLVDFPGRKIFLQQVIDTPASRKGREPVATRECFPATFRAAVRQKSRWILGIALQGWGEGWTDSLGTNYCLLRDRKAPLTNVFVMLGYVVGLFWIWAALANAFGTGRSIPPLIGADEIYAYLTWTVLGILIWRIVNRIVATGRVYGVAEGILAVPRLIFGNVLNFCATVHALGRFLRYRFSGRTPPWGHTAHVFPSEDQLREYRRRLGDLLLERRFVTPAQLEQALAQQRQTGQKLGEILLEMGVLWEEDLVFTLARQRQRAAVEIDPDTVSSDVLRRVPREVAERHHVFPLRQENGRIVLASDAMDLDTLQKTLGEELGADVTLHMAGARDIDFAIERGYGRNGAEPPDLAERLGQRLLRKGLVDEPTLKTALRLQKRTRGKLGEILVEMGQLTAEQIEEELGGR